MKLMIVESPGKKAKLGEILAALRPNENWRVEASVGHVRDLPERGNQEGFITTGVRSDFTPFYELTERGGDVVGKLKRICATAEEIYLATDPDREGESISWHLKEALGLRAPIRVAFNEITEGKIREALEAPRRIDMKRVSAQEARRVLDRLVGYLVSEELRRQTGDALSAGRVQSVAVYLVVKREREIRVFKSVNHYSASVTFGSANEAKSWSAEWVTKEGFTTDDNPYFLDRRYAEQVAAVRRLVVRSCEESEEKRNPPAPFITSTLQQAASNALKWEPDKTMQVAQALYEQGHITYHRTDNPNVSDEVMSEIQAVARALKLDVVEQRRKFKAKEGAQEGHPAIMPTHWEIDAAGESAEQRALYQLIRVRALASQLMPARYSARTIILDAAGPVEGRPVAFGAKGRTLVYPGWLALQTGDATEDEDESEDDNNPIPMLTAGAIVDASSGKLLEKRTKAPPRYTLASLIKALEAEGIGRPATYAAIMSNIVKRGYVDAEKRFLAALPKGETVIDRLEGKFSFLDVNFTRAMESELDRIERGESQYRPVIEQLHTSLAADLRAQAVTPAFQRVVQVHPCPACGKPLRRIKGAHGFFWGCTGHPECSETLPDSKGAPGQRKAVESSNFDCGRCGKPLVHRQKKGKGGYDFWGCSGYASGCKESYPNLKGKPDFSKAKG